MIMGVFKKLLIATVFVTVFISIFCISSSAAIQYGAEYLDPDYYADDIGLVVILLANQFDDPEDFIAIPLAQYRIPDSSSGQFSLTNLNILYDIDSSDTVSEFYFGDITLLEDSQGNTLDLSSVDVVFHDLNTYPVTSDYWDDPFFACFYGSHSLGSVNYYEFLLSDLPLDFPRNNPFNSVDYSEGPIFFALICDVWDDTVPVYPSVIPTYPARPLPPDPPVTDIPLNPGNINKVLGQIFETPVDTLSRIFTATNTLYAFISVFVFFMFVRFILKPILGGGLFVGASDHVKAMKRDENDSERYGYYKNAHEYYDKKNRGG